MSGYYGESGRRKERRIEDEFEPTILSEKYMTEKDDMIRNTDFPERLQVKSDWGICTCACLPTFFFFFC